MSNNINILYERQRYVYFHMLFHPPTIATQEHAQNNNNENKKYNIMYYFKQLKACLSFIRGTKSEARVCSYEVISLSKHCEIIHNNSIRP